MNYVKKLRMLLGRNKLGYDAEAKNVRRLEAINTNITMSTTKKTTTTYTTAKSSNRHEPVTASTITKLSIEIVIKV